MPYGTRSAVAGALSGAADRFGDLLLGLDARRRQDAERKRLLAERTAEREATAKYRAATLANDAARTKAALARENFRPVGPVGTPSRDPFGFRFQTNPLELPGMSLGRGSAPDPAGPAAGMFSKAVLGPQAGTPTPAAPEAGGTFSRAALAALAPSGTPSGTPGRGEIVFDGQRYRYVEPPGPRGFDPATDVQTQRELYNMRNRTGPYRYLRPGFGSTGGGGGGSNRIPLTADQALDQVKDIYAKTDAQGYIVGSRLDPNKLAAAADSLRLGGRLPPIPAAPPDTTKGDNFNLDEPPQDEAPGAFWRLMGNIGQRIAGLFEGAPMATPTMPDPNDPRNAKLVEILNDPRFTDEQKRLLIGELFPAEATP